jgi:hypothetical protein
MDKCGNDSEAQKLVLKYFNQNMYQELIQLL